MDLLARETATLEADDGWTVTEEGHPLVGLVPAGEGRCVVVGAEPEVPQTRLHRLRSRLAVEPGPVAERRAWLPRALFESLLIVLSAAIQINMVMLGIMIGILGGFGGDAIILKSQALSIKVKAYIDAARVAGGGDGHIIFRHIIPNVLPLSLLYMMFGVTTAIALEATLSYLGLLNIQMSWGIMINTAQNAGYLLSGTSYWWLLFPAGLAVSFLAFGFFVVGRGMDEVINPRLRAR